MPEAELLKIIGDYDGLVVRSATKVRYMYISCLNEMVW